MEATKEQTISVELTESQYLHIQSILKQDKPSKTRLSREEKEMILHMCKKWNNLCSTEDYEDDLLKSIKNKLK